MIKTVFVTFQEEYSTERQYSYLYEGDIAVGDLAVVKTPRKGYAVVRVDRVEEGRGPKAEKFIIDTVDVAAWEERIEREAKRKRLVKELEARQKRLLEEEQFAWLAAQDPEAAEMVRQLKELSE